MGGCVKEGGKGEGRGGCAGCAGVLSSLTRTGSDLLTASIDG